MTILQNFVKSAYLEVACLKKSGICGITVDSLYLELARDQRICSRYREFEIEREKYATANTKGPRH